MGKSNTTIYKNLNEQYQTTIPKVLAEALDLKKGDKVVWEINSSNSLVMRRIRKG